LENIFNVGQYFIALFERCRNLIRGHPLSFLREDLRRRRIVTCAEAMAARDGRWLEAAGLVLVRQMPGSAKGVLFVTIEDETGSANLVVWPEVFERQRRIVLAAGMLGAQGRIQREGEVVYLVARHLTDLSPDLASVGDRDIPVPHGRGDEFHHGSPGLDHRSLPKGPKPRDIEDSYRHLDQGEDAGFQVIASLHLRFATPPYQL
jgi:error-prone DNA polymerase